MLSPKSLIVALVGGAMSTVVPATPPSSPPPPSAPAPAVHGLREGSSAYVAFGRSVAIGGDFAFVGEPNVSAAGGRGGRPSAPAAGVVHVFRFSAGAWKAAGEVTSSASSAGDGFGVSMATDGATLLVGQVRPAPVATPAGPPGRGGAAQQPAGPPPADTAVGSVQLFRRGADMKWTAAGTLDAPRNAGAMFGAAIAMSGNVALVGAPRESGTGAVYVYTRGANDTWSASGTLPAQSLAANDAFGMAVAIDGDRVAVGAPGRARRGAVFVFRRDGDRWVQETEQVAPPAVPANGMFGAAVAVKGDRVIAGAPAANHAPSPVSAVTDSMFALLAQAPAGAVRDSVLNQITMLATGQTRLPINPRALAAANVASGMVVVFERASFGSWRTINTLAPFDYGNAGFGASLAVVGNELWIGAPLSDGAGRIYRAVADRDGAWGSMSKIGVDTIEAGAQWASSFAVSGDRAIVGMPGDGGGGGTAALLAKTAGEWKLAKLVMPPVNERFAKVAGKELACGGDGKASAFECKSTGLLSYLPISAVGGKRGVNLSGSWGWTDPVTGHDIAILGRTDAAAFVDVTDPVNPRYLGDLPRTKGANMSSWREIKTYKNYALIVSDGSGDHHGIQIFDLTKLRGVTQPKRFTEDAHFDAGSIHDIAVNEASGYAYAVGTASGGERCSGGSMFINMKNPLKPEFAGCFADVGTGRARGGYTHDILCVMYKGPDTRYTGHEICMASNETTVSIQDVTDKKNVKVLSHADYPTPGYTHQGWFTEDQKYFYMNDELDETGNIGKSAEGTRTMIFDVSDLEQPLMKKEYIGPTHASDHNLYVKGDRMYQSNYKAGLRILDITDPLNPKEVGFMDTNPGENTAGFQGSWNNYPFFKNGAIGVVSIGEGFFMVRDVPRDGTRKIVP